MRPIIDRIVAVVQHEGWVYYCGNMRIPINDFDGALSGKITMCRVVSYTKDTGTLWVKVESRTQLNKEHYEMNTEANKEIFSDNPVKKIILNSIYRQTAIKSHSDITSKQKGNIALYDYDVEFEESIEDIFKEPEAKNSI